MSRIDKIVLNPFFPKVNKVKINLKNIFFQKTKLLLAGIGISSFLAVMIVLSLNINGPKKSVAPPKLPENPQHADIMINNFHYVSTNEKGVKEWELKANAASYFQEKKMAGFERVNVIFYAKEGRTFTLRGDKGVLNTEAKDFDLTGDVVGTSSDGYTFRTESINYSAEKRQVKTDKKVFLENPQFKLEGKGMVVDIKEQKLYLLNNVTAQGAKGKEKSLSTYNPLKVR